MKKEVFQYLSKEHIQQLYELIKEAGARQAEDAIRQDTEFYTDTSVCLAHNYFICRDILKLPSVRMTDEQYELVNKAAESLLTKYQQKLQTSDEDFLRLSRMLDNNELIIQADEEIKELVYDLLNMSVNGLIDASANRRLNLYQKCMNSTETVIKELFRKDYEWLYFISSILVDRPSACMEKALKELVDDIFKPTHMFDLEEAWEKELSTILED